MKAAKLKKLRRKTYRDAYVKAHVEQGLAFQIREMRERRGLTQRQLAEALELRSQSAIARLENPGYGKMSLATLLKVAAFFDVALLAKMVPYSRFLCEIDDVSPQALDALSFGAEDAIGAIENAPEFRLIPNTSVTSQSGALVNWGGSWLTPQTSNFLTMDLGMLEETNQYSIALQPLERNTHATEN